MGGAGRAVNGAHVACLGALVAAGVAVATCVEAHETEEADHTVAVVVEAALERGLSLIDAATYGELARSEGLRLEPYRDAGGLLTVCIGETRGVEQRTYTVAECVERFLGRVEHDFAAPVARCTLTWEALPVLAREAVVEFAYNVGVHAYCGGSVRKWLDAGYGPRACDRMLLYDKVRIDGELVESHGLYLRRQREAAECRGGFPAQ